MKYKRVLTIAGSDSGGGAGIQADIKSVSANGCYAATAITAVTVQNTVGVKDVFPIPVGVIGEQIDAVLSDIGADSIKIGMLHSAEVVCEVAAKLRLHSMQNIVLDPVMVATSGDVLLKESAIEAIKRELFPLVKVITPNIPEAETLLERKITNLEEMAEAAKELGREYGVSVLVKGGHLITGEMMSDVLYDTTTRDCKVFNSFRIETKNTHGTGCTLSSAIAANLAKGLSLMLSVERAIAYINGAIEAASEYEIGQGHGPVHHFYKFWK